jgi:DNA-directed RNA polymerase specialized sigma24 family protein
MVDSRGHPYALIAELNAEWTRLGDDSDAAVRDWASRHPALLSCRTLPDVLAAIRADPDSAFAALLTEAAEGDGLAGRVVLQAMLGKVVRLAQTHPDVEVEEFVSALWCRIQTYPLARRPVRIAANLALDTRKDALAASRNHRREHAVGSLCEPRWESLLARRHADLTDHEDDASQARRVLEAARAVGLLDESTSLVLQTVYLDGASSRSAAVRHDTTAAMVRYRCSTALRRLSRHAERLRTAA